MTECLSVHATCVRNATCPADAVAVHGLTAGLLADKPLLAAVADEFLAFVGDAPLVAHNAGFDIAFLNAELTRAARSPTATERVVDSLVLAAQASRRTQHARRLMFALWRKCAANIGALLDAELLAAVYVELTRTPSGASA